MLTVHKDAVTVMQGNRMVFLVDKEKLAQPRPVMLGSAVGGRFEVLEGLVEGDLVVVRGNERLQPGQEVMFQPPAGEASPGAQPPAGEADPDAQSPAGEAGTDTSTTSGQAAEAGERS